MKKNTLRRILALVLAIAMFGSDLALVTSANDSVYCGIEDHVHTDACYVQQTEPAATETVPGTEPAATETTPATEAPAETTPTTEPEATETMPVIETLPTEVVTDEAMAAAEEETVLLEELRGTQTLKELYDAIVAAGQRAYGLAEAELAELQTHAETIYTALATPTEEDETYRELLVVAFAHVASKGSIPLDAVALTKAVAEAALESKYYFLIGDLKLTKAAHSSGYIYVPAATNVTIDLNGYALIGNKKESVIYNSDGELTIEDSRPDSIPHYFRQQEHAAWILLDEYEENAVEVFGGIITGGRYTGSSTGGGGIQMGVMDFVTKTTMNGGTIIGNHSNRAGAGSYGGVFTMNGGTIKGNYATLMGGGVSVSGEFVMNGGYIGQNSISPDSKHASGASDESNTGFYDNPEITLGMNSSFTMTNGTIEGNISTVSSTGSPQPTTNISGGTINGNFRILNKNTTTISGTAVFNGRIYMANGNCTVKENGVIQNGKGGNGGSVYLANGSFFMEGGAIRNAKADSYGGAVYVAKGNFGMTGGTIENNTAALRGGAVYVSGGNFTMTGGTIDSNQATAENSEGGAVYVTGGNIFIGKEGCADNTCLTVSNNTAVNGGAFAVTGATPVMYCGTVTGNTADEMGGALYVSGSGGFTMYGGIIDGGSAEKNAKLGGGVYLAAGAFTMDGANAFIQDNHANNGAGVYLAGGQPNLYKGSMIGNTATGDGGGIYIDKQLVNLKPTGLVTITGNHANRGGGIFIGGTNGNDACFSVDSADGGNVNLSSNTARAEGGAVCISNGYFTLDADNITLQDNQAASGGAVAVLSGNFTMSNGVIGAAGHGNEAVNGGAVYVGGGDVRISGGYVHYNQAQQNGGGIAVSDGNIIMSGGHVSNNRAVNGSGGGMYVTSVSNTVAVKVYSGHIEGNSALDSGGAVAVKGSQSSTIKVQIGVNHVHPGSAFDHAEPEGIYTHSYCPQIKNNASAKSGGAFYITGGSDTNLRMFCLEETGNSATGDLDINNIPLSDFLMVNGGEVVITTASAENSNCDCEGESHDHDNHDNMGKAHIYGSVHVTGGTLDLYGNMDNPAFERYITVDLTKQEDHYYDHRDNNENIKLVYHENFDYNGVVDSTYTAIDVKVGETQTISDSFYKHEGYQIYGWNTDKYATPLTSTGWYDNGTKYLFVKDEADKEQYPLGDAQKYQVGDLTLYAIWEPNGYSVKFDPNVPEGEKYTGEKMENQPFTYNVEDNLWLNTYGRIGYTFEGWTYVDDHGETKTLTDGQRVINLTAVKGGTVILKAIWEVCTHPSGKIQYRAEQESDQKSALVKTCTDCQYKATVTLTAKDDVYDGNSHPAKVTCSDPDWFLIEDSDIRYAGTKIDKTESVENPQLATNAGNYMATITAPDNTAAASVTFTIAKAPQPGPAVKPTYTEPEQNTNILKVHPLAPAGENVSSVSGLPVEFIARYYKDGTVYDTGWHPITRDGEGYADTEIALTEELKYYFVYARYAGNDNYLPSSETMADGTFLFEGNITLKFVVDPGITYYPTESTGQLQINVMVDDDHYLVGGSPTVTKENDAEDRLIITENGDWSFIITKNPEVVSTEPVIITIRIGTAKDKPTISSAVQEKQIFAAVVNDDDPCISRDSAYTVSYTVTHYKKWPMRTATALTLSKSSPPIW